MSKQIPIIHLRLLLFWLQQITRSSLILTINSTADSRIIRCFYSANCEFHTAYYLTRHYSRKKCAHCCLDDMPAAKKKKPTKRNQIKQCESFISYMEGERVRECKKKSIRLMFLANVCNRTKEQTTMMTMTTTTAATTAARHGYFRKHAFSLSLCWPGYEWVESEIYFSKYRYDFWRPSNWFLRYFWHQRPMSKVPIDWTIDVYILGIDGFAAINVGAQKKSGISGFLFFLALLLLLISRAG